jgi:hypothetical protein
MSLTTNAVNHGGLGFAYNTGGKKQQAKLEISVDTVRAHLPIDGRIGMPAVARASFGLIGWWPRA